MSESVVGDFRNFCLESCCESKYNLRVRPVYTCNKKKSDYWWLEGVITTGAKKEYIIVKSNLITWSDAGYSLVMSYQSDRTNVRASMEQLKELITYWEKLPK